MSRRSYRRTRRAHRSGAGLVILFLVLATVALGGIASTTPIPDGVVGFAFVLVVVVALVTGGGSHRRGRRHG